MVKEYRSKVFNFYKWSIINNRLRLKCKIKFKDTFQDKMSMISNKYGFYWYVELKR